jgi:hypothetical protein
MDTIILSNFENFTFFSRGTSILISENYPTNFENKLESTKNKFLQEVRMENWKK